MEQIRQIPYGVADFESVMKRGLYYVDKTMYLAELEKQPDTQIFILSLIHISEPTRP